jgi:hypothetical protein
MKKILLMTGFYALVMGMAAQAHAWEPEFRCTASSVTECESATQAVLERHACGLVKDSVRCEELEETTGNKAIYCSARAESCGMPSSDGFLGVDCRENGRKVAIGDRRLTATWSVGFLRHWVRDLCVYSR